MTKVSGRNVLTHSLIIKIKGNRFYIKKKKKLKKQNPPIISIKKILLHFGNDYGH